MSLLLRDFPEAAALSPESCLPAIVTLPASGCHPISQYTHDQSLHHACSNIHYGEVTGCKEGGRFCGELSSSGGGQSSSLLVHRPARPECNIKASCKSSLQKRQPPSSVTLIRPSRRSACANATWRLQRERCADRVCRRDRLWNPATRRYSWAVRRVAVLAAPCWSLVWCRVGTVATCCR